MQVITGEGSRFSEVVGGRPALFPRGQRSGKVEAGEKTPMYLKCYLRRKDGKEHRYWSILEKRRCAGGRTVDRQVLYLGEINDSQRQAWEQCVEVFDADQGRQTRLALYPEDRTIPARAAEYGVQVRLRDFTLRRPRQWGAC